jgi:hypothetical protein
LLESGSGTGYARRVSRTFSKKFAAAHPFSAVGRKCSQRSVIAASVEVSDYAAALADLFYPRCRRVDAGDLGTVCP